MRQAAFTVPAGVIAGRARLTGPTTGNDDRSHGFGTFTGTATPSPAGAGGRTLPRPTTGQVPAAAGADR